MTTLAMFPLGTVLFPHVPLPLHVFEERYRVMTRRCLDDEQPFGVVLIERGSEVGGGDLRFDVGTTAEIVESRELPDGRWLLGVVGRARVRVVEWLADDPHPWAVVERWDDPPATDDDRSRRDGVERRVRRLIALATELERDAHLPPTALELDPDPVVASYQACALSGAGPLDAQHLLEQPDAAGRLAMLERILDEQAAILEHRLASG